MNILIPGLTAATLLLAAPANAQPPALGSVGAFTTPSIVCDTREEIHSILNAFEKGVAAGTARFHGALPHAQRAARTDMRDHFCPKRRRRWAGNAWPDQCCWR